MMEQNMAEPKKTVPRNKVMRISWVLTAMFGAILIAARMVGILPMANELSAAGVIALCVVVTAVALGIAGWYISHTDEHDLHANLWSMSWAWIASALITVNWGMLYIGKLAPVPNTLMILLASTAVAAVIWAWMRFR
jgi:hypothetical protein